MGINTQNDGEEQQTTMASAFGKAHATVQNTERAQPQVQAVPQETPQPQPQPTPQSKPAMENTQQHPRNFFSPNLRSSAAFGSPIGKGMGSEYLKKIMDGLKEIYKNSNDPSTIIQVLDLDNTNHTGLWFSCLLVCMYKLDEKNQPRNVLVQPLLIEATGNQVTPIFENINGRQVEITRTAGQAMDMRLSRAIDQRVQASIPGANISLIPGTVVPRSFDPDNKERMHMLALNAAFACGVELAISVGGFTDLNLAEVPAAQLGMQISIGYLPTQIKNVVGEPMRSDVLISMSSTQRGNQNNNQSLNSDAREVKFSEISAFMDLVWNPVVQQNAFGYSQNMQQLVPGQLPTQKYSARAVISNLAMESIYTPSSIMFALATISTLSHRSNWMLAFRPTTTQPGEIDFRDIGAMNIEANINNERDNNYYGTRIDTKVASFTLESLGEYINAIITPGLIISMDCPEAGPQSWYTNIFSMAESGNKTALQDIMAACQQLTGGAFGQIFPQNAPVFTDQNNIIHLGYWTDRAGNQRDIRDVDTIFMANVVGERNPQLISQWQNTFLRQEFSLPERLAERKKLIMAVTNETAVFTGFARRVTFSAVFLDSLVKAIQSCNFQFVVNAPLSAAEMQNQRGVAGFASTALLMPSQGLANTSFSSPQQYNVGHYNFGGRYA